MRNIFIVTVVIALLILNIKEGPKDYSTQISEVERVIKTKGYNNKYAFLIDFSIHSGKNRMFLYNLEKKKVEKQFLVAHGEGCGSTNGTPDEFSNVVGSNCSSEGLSIINGRDYSNWGVNIKYWLDGLSESNSNLRKRVVVLHSWWGVPDVEIYPIRLVESQGCFTISNKSMIYIDNFIKNQKNKKIVIYSFKDG